MTFNEEESQSREMRGKWRNSEKQRDFKEEETMITLRTKPFS